MAKKPDEPVVPDVESFESDDYGVYVQNTARDIWTHDDTGHLLTVEEALFCRSYIVDRNPVAAMRRLNYSGETEVLRRRADRMLSNPEVQACVDTLAKKMMDRLEVTADRVQRAVAAVAFFDVREVVTVDNGGIGIKDFRFWTKEQAAAVKSVKRGQHGVELQFHDKLRAAEILAKQLGTLPEEDSAAAMIAATKAGAEVVMDKIMQVFDRTFPEDKAPALPAPDGE